jgi:hypothetical protein
MISERIQSPQAREIAMNKILLATATFALVAGAAPLSAQQATTKDQLIGSWKVLSGHSSIVMTMDTYGHLFPRGDDGAELAEAERALLG